MKVEEFTASEPRKLEPSIAEMAGLIPDILGGKSLKEYMEDLRDG
jgi:hypothetical protein